MNFFLNNWLNLLGLLGTIGFGVLSVVLYFRSIHKPLPAYGVHAFRVKIVDKSRARLSGLQLLLNQVPIDAHNITAAMVYVWNAGRAPIKRVDVLSDFSIFLMDEESIILDHSITRTSREVCGISASANERRVIMSFDILEHGDGAMVQIVFSGNPDAPIIVKGAAVGAHSVLKAPLETLLNKPAKTESLFVTLLGLLIAAGGLYSLSGAFYAPDGWFGAHKLIRIETLRILGSLPFAGFGVWLLAQGVSGLHSITSSLRGSLSKLSSGS